MHALRRLTPPGRGCRAQAAARVTTPAGRRSSSRSMAAHDSSTTSSSSQQEQLLPPELAGFRPNVGVCVFHPGTRKVFAATRLDDNARSWQMPQGGIDPGETPLQAALRELAEETSIRSVEVVAELPRWLPYEFPTAVKCTLTGSWADYKGQAQRWFLVKFVGEDAEVDLETAHREFAEWRWMPLEELPDAVIHFKRDVYTLVVREFAPLIAAAVAANAGGS